MANSNCRTKEFDTVHHLVSRIAHRVYFLKDEDRNDFVEMMRRAADFCGIELVGWCVMTNHFHILAYLPQRMEVDEPEVLRRYGRLRGQAVAEMKAKEFAEWRQKGECGEKRVQDWLARARHRMYDIGSFMKIVKQWFTESYNLRYSHKGTLWESAYYDRVVSFAQSEIAKCLGYIHLNPIRAAAVARYDEYIWSSYTAFRRGDPVAVKGMRIAYGDEMSEEEITMCHVELLDGLLEEVKLRRAEDIARKRAAGYEIPADVLTSEAMIAQAAAHLEEVRVASVAIRAEACVRSKWAEKKEAQISRIRAYLVNCVEVTAKDIAAATDIPVRTTYRLLTDMVAGGMAEQLDCGVARLYRWKNLARAV